MNNYNDIMVISGDVYTIIKCMQQKGWSSLKESSINRMIYLCAVIYSFMHEDCENIFARNYNFSVTLSGPEDVNISRALTNLRSNDVICIGEKGYFINENNDKSSVSLSLSQEKSEWIDDISYIFGLYGEGKIYDFVFRDPQYQNSVKANSLTTLNLDKNNETVVFLEKFKAEFEKHIEAEQKLNNRKYLELYFEYVFGKIIRGEL